MKFVIEFSQEETYEMMNSPANIEKATLRFKTILLNRLNEEVTNYVKSKSPKKGGNHG